MLRRCTPFLVLVALWTPSAAVAQPSGGSPFGPLPQTPQAPPETPEPQPVDPDANEDGLGGTAFWLIIGTTGLIFVAVAFFITRDMRRTVGARRGRKRRRRRPAAAAADALTSDGRRTSSQKARAKAQQRAKTKAARKQRRKSRSR